MLLVLDVPGEVDGAALARADLLDNVVGLEDTVTQLDFVAVFLFVGCLYLNLSLVRHDCDLGLCGFVQRVWSYFCRQC